jgi:hypothetical protein
MAGMAYSAEVVRAFLAKIHHLAAKITAQITKFVRYFLAFP